jgi:hypothetical protein
MDRGGQVLGKSLWTTSLLWCGQTISLQLPKATWLPLDMSKIHTDCPGFSDPSDRSLTTDVLLRQAPDDEDDEQDEEDEDSEEDDDEEGDDNEDDDGYSE